MIIQTQRYTHHCVSVTVIDVLKKQCHAISTLFGSNNSNRQKRFRELYVCAKIFAKNELALLLIDYADPDG